jgi:hypothetical protein
MEVMFERVAGLDVGKASVTVCVRTPGTRPGVRRDPPAWHWFDQGAPSSRTSGSPATGT